MPTYQYACTNPDCGNRFELVQSFTDAAVTECPVCGQRVRKVYGSVGVVFKGSGFYRTDSRAEGRANASTSGTVKSDTSKSETSKSSDGAKSSDSSAASSGSSSSTASSSGGSSGTSKAAASA